MTQDKIQQDFNDFVNCNKDFNTDKLDKEILHYVKQELAPNHGQVFSKLLSIQAFVGLLSLSLCPQFDISLTNNYAFFHYLHHTFGTYTCYAICGAIFIGSGAVFASYLLNKKEILKIKESRFLYYSSISLLAVLAFLFLGADIYLGMAAAWFLGASLGGVIMLEINSFIKKAYL